MEEEVAYCEQTLGPHWFLVLSSVNGVGLGLGGDEMEVRPKPKGPLESLCNLVHAELFKM